MPKWMKPDLRMLLRMAVIVAAVTVVSASLRGQGGALGQVKADEPFGAYDAALVGAAEAMLSTAAEPVGYDPNSVQAGVAMPVANIEVQVFPLAGGGLGSAAARVELLRPVIEPIFASHGVPAEMAAAVMMVESGGLSRAISSKGARGLWQLMPDTARRYGLRVDENVDERLDLFEATAAAAQYLHDLYARFGDWRLALAGYNAGEASVSVAILKAHSQNFGRLSDLRMLPLETRQYVPKVLAGVRLPRPSKENHRSTGTTVFALN